MAPFLLVLFQLQTSKLGNITQLIHTLLMKLLLLTRTTTNPFLSQNTSISLDTWMIGIAWRTRIVRCISLYHGTTAGLSSSFIGSTSTKMSMLTMTSICREWLSIMYSTQTRILLKKSPILLWLNLILMLGHLSLVLLLTRFHMLDGLKAVLILSSSRMSPLIQLLIAAQWFKQHSRQLTITTIITTH